MSVAPVLSAMVTRFTDERADLVVGGSEAAARFGEADEFPAEEDRCAIACG